MLYNIDLNESNYVQPVRGFVERKMQNNNTELVDFVPESHIRIWYNVQLEGYPSHHHSAAEVIICSHRQQCTLHTTSGRHSDHSATCHS